jgi:hypothetical protein
MPSDRKRTMAETERNPGPDNEGADTQKTDAKAPAAQAPALNQIEAPQKDGKPNGIRQTKANWPTKVTWSGILATTIALSAVIQAGTSWWQGRATQQQYDVMLLDLRPWLGVDMPKIDEPVSGKRIDCVLTARNAGKSPAFVFSQGAAIRIAAQPIDGSAIDFERIFPLVNDHPPSAPGVWPSPLLPGEKQEFAAHSDPIDDEVLSALKIGRKKIVVTCGFKYLDSGRKIHRTMRTWIYDIRGDRGVEFHEFNFMD